MARPRADKYLQSLSNEWLIGKLALSAYTGRSFEESELMPQCSGGCGCARCRTRRRGKLIIDILFDAGKWEESRHPRGQPGNAGEFAKAGGGVHPAKARSKSAPHKRASAPSTTQEVKTEQKPSNADAIKAFVDAQRARRHWRAQHKKATAASAPQEKLDQLKLKWAEAHQQLIQAKKLLKIAGAKPAPPDVRGARRIPPPLPPVPIKPEGEVKTEPPALSQKAGLAAIAEASRQKGAPEREWHEKAFSHASMRMAAIIRNESPVIVVESSRLGFYSGSLRTINLPKQYYGARGERVWRHEFGHAIDDTGLGNYRSVALQEVLLREGRDLVHADVSSAPLLPKLPTAANAGQLEQVHGLPSGYLSGLGKQSLEAFGKLMRPETRPNNRMLEALTPTMADLGGVLDFFGALTLNEIGYGHSKEYYAERPQQRVKECFADYVAATEGPHGQMYKLVFFRYAPKLCAGFESILDKVAGGA